MPSRAPRQREDGPRRKATFSNVGADASKAKHAPAIAEEGRDGEIRYFGEMEPSTAAVGRFVRKPASEDLRKQRQEGQAFVKPFLEPFSLVGSRHLHSI